MSDGDGSSFVEQGIDYWFSSDSDKDQGPKGWRLDVVTLLAVIGESSIADHSQTITASMLCLLPRIIPAPQALLKSSRPQRLPETSAKITGVYSGVSLDSAGFFANILHPVDEFAPFAFQALRISHTDQYDDIDVHHQPATEGGGLGGIVRRFTQAVSHKPSRLSIPGPPGSNADRLANGGRSKDVEAQCPNPGLIRRQTVKERVTDYIANPTLLHSAKRPAVPAALWSPVHILSVLSMFLTFGIIGFAAKERDGTAILAVSLVSLASSVVGVASWWRPLLMKRRSTNQVPDGDVVIRTREGAFILVQCTENVARELYAGTEECEYRIGGQAYKILMGLGTLLLMVSVILLGNCKWHSQIFIGAAYIVLNGMYWVMGLLPKRYFWDLSRYKIEDITPEHSKNADKTTDDHDPTKIKSFTRTLWYCIRETKRVAWVERSGAAPGTPQWKAWLREAERAAIHEDINWDAIKRKDELMKMSEKDIEVELQGRSQTPDPLDPAEQVAPASEVQAPPQQQPQPGTL
jgi:hypothetical protein